MIIWTDFATGMWHAHQDGEHVATVICKRGVYQFHNELSGSGPHACGVTETAAKTEAAQDVIDYRRSAGRRK